MSNIISTTVPNVDTKQTAIEAMFKSMPITFPKVDEVIEGKVIDTRKHALYVNLSPFGTGIIYGREFNNAVDTIKSLKPGDTVTAKVLEIENELGYVALSLRGAKEEVVWREIEEAQKNNTTFNLAVLEANKGGLIIEWKNVKGFLPASQLKSDHYPKIEDGDKDKILEELKKLVGTKISVAIIGHDQKENKLIFSEKETGINEVRQTIAKYKVGDIVDGTVTGVVDFGVFLKIEEGLEGLVHISELNWSLVDNPNSLYKIGDKIKAQIISIKDDKISLSVKALQTDPWDSIKEKYKKGDIVKGVIIRFNKHGALASIEEGVAGLVHISEFKTEDAMKKALELGKTYPFQVLVFEPKEHRLVLNYLEDPSKAEEKKAEVKE